MEDPPRRGSHVLPYAYSPPRPPPNAKHETVPKARHLSIATVLQGVYLLVFGPMGRRLLSLPATNGASAQGALRFALTTAATGHAVIALALRLAEGAVSGGGAKAAGIGRREAMQRPVAPPVGEVRSFVCRQI